jgi:hypothetical protein
VGQDLVERSDAAAATDEGDFIKLIGLVRELGDRAFDGQSLSFLREM